MPSPLPLILMAGAAALLLSKKKKVPVEETGSGIESHPSIPEDDDTRATSNAQKCNEFLSQLYVEPQGDELPILSIAVEEQILPFLEDEIDKILEEKNAVDVTQDAPVLAIEALNEIAPPCNWQHEFTGEYWHLVYPNDDRAKSIYNAVSHLATQVALDANEKASGKGLSQGDEPQKAGFQDKG